MCLSFFMPVNEEEGTGYKLVRRTADPQVFENYYTRFKHDDDGRLVGIGPANTLRNSGGRNKVLPGCTYTLGKTYQVRHRRKTTTFQGGHEYSAGVHLFKDNTYGLYQAAKTVRYYPETYAMLQCRWSNPIGQDFQTLVAMKVTPLKEVDPDVLLADVPDWGEDSYAPPSRL